MQTLHLPKRGRPSQQDVFKRKWHDHLTEMQLAAVLDRFGHQVDDIASVNLAIVTKAGKIEMIEAPKP